MITWKSITPTEPKGVEDVLVYGPCCDVCYQVKIAFREDGKWHNTEGGKLFFKPTHYCELIPPTDQ